ncbi:hypothetical protein L2E82_34259 [Cichorium intybus]|uniref:Uncharacterized protein n=1 Tax=Cichorium intybus TaxID=13427 RepID=A0ACB9BLT7_CICIN|nr:hypothetical protein L2E82_34259 [Cichorium intybus]
MANPDQQQTSIKPWILEVVPFVVVVLIAAHVIALISYRKTPWTKKEALVLLLSIRSPVVKQRNEDVVIQDLVSVLEY